MLATLLPRSSAPISRSRSWIRRPTMPARRSPAFSSCSMRALEAAVTAVSEPEKKPEMAISTMIAPAVTQISSALISGDLLLKERGDRRRRHIARDERLADAAGEDERQLAACHLLVLADEFHHRGGGEPRTRNIAD